MPVLASPLVADPIARALATTSTVASWAHRRRSRTGMGDGDVVTARVRVPTRHGAVTCVRYARRDAAARGPLYVNVHGGGFVIGYPEQDDPWCRHLVARTGVTVLNVDYATAPRRRFPVAVEQVDDVVSWATREQRDRGGGRVAVGGQSAGGNLAAAAARLALERGDDAIALQVLHYAVLDLVTPREEKSTGTTGRELPPAWMAEVFHTAYVPRLASREDRLVSPAWGANVDGLAGVAPALVVTAEHDRLRAEGARYAARLEEVGRLVEYIDVAGVGHGYDIVGESDGTTRTMRDRLADHIARALG